MQLNYKSFGQGQPLIVLHGLFGALDNWQTLAKRWAEHFTVFILDQRNHGRSPHDPRIDYPSMADDLRHFMEENWVYQAHILGHSMGGKTAMEFALHYPDMVSRLLVLDIAPKVYPGGHEQIFEALVALDLTGLADRKEAEAFLEARIAEWGVRQFLLKNLTRKPTGGFAWKMNLPAIQRHYADILGNLTPAEAPFDGPTLFLRGEHSAYIDPEADLPAIHTLFPQANLHTVPQAGHWLHADQPELIYQEVLQFLQA